MVDTVISATVNPEELDNENWLLGELPGSMP
jgi:hypothetical protein